MEKAQAPHEGGGGNLLEIVDTLCDVTEQLAGIVRKQAELIEQEKIAGAAYENDFSGERKEVEKELNRIETKMRRM